MDLPTAPPGLGGAKAALMYFKNLILISQLVKSVCKNSNQACTKMALIHLLALSKITNLLGNIE